MIPTYKPSNRFEYLFLLLIPIGACVGFGLSLIYLILSLFSLALIMGIFPLFFIISSAFFIYITIWYADILIMVSTFTINKGKCRSPFGAVVAALIISAPVVIAPLTILVVAGGYSEIVQTLSPSSLTVEEGNKSPSQVGEGRKKMFHDLTHGDMFLMLILMLIGLTYGAIRASLAAAAAAKKPFSETYKGWATEEWRLTIHAPSERMIAQLRQVKNIQEIFTVPIEIVSIEVEADNGKKQAQKQDWLATIIPLVLITFVLVLFVLFLIALVRATSYYFIIGNILLAIAIIIAVIVLLNAKITHILIPSMSNNVSLTWIVHSHPADNDNGFLSIILTTAETKNEKIFDNIMLGRNNISLYREFFACTSDSIPTLSLPSSDDEY